MEKNKNTDSGLNIDKLVTFCKANVKYISAGVLTVVLIVILAFAAAGNKGEKDKSPKKSETRQEEQQADASNKEEAEDSEKKESNPEIENLMSTYYNSYATGDVDKLSEITKSLSDMEKNYIKMMNEQVESYSNVSCTVEPGKNEKSYVVAVVYDMKFEGVEETLPGMNVFYVQTNKNGELYINNLYSSFNRELGEQKTKKKIIKLIEEFENSDAVQKLQQEVQGKYDQIINKSEDLQKKVNEAAEAITKWKDSYKPEEAQPEETQEEQSQPEEDNQNEAQQEQPEEDNQDETQQETSQENQDGGTDDGLNYVPEGTVLTANDGYNVRVSMSETAELVGTTAIGDSIKVVLSYAEGWTKVEWNGKTGYIKTELLLQN